MVDRLNSLFVAAVTRLNSEEKGQALTEYALVLAVPMVAAYVRQEAHARALRAPVASGS